MDLEGALATAKALADRSRLMILRALRDRPLCAEEVAAALDLALSTVSFHLRKLADAGLVTMERDQYYAVYTLRPESLTRSLADLVDFPNPALAAQASRAAEERRAVMRAFFADGRLVRMPAQKRKRTLVLEVFAGLFDTGRDYPETEVDARIQRLFDDHCLVRRLLADEGYFTRSRGVYRRTDKPGAALETNASIKGQPPRRSTTQRGGGPVDARKKALKRDYLQQERETGIFRIVNRQTDRALTGSSLDVRAALNRSEFELTRGSHGNRGLQDDFTRLGREAFSFEVVETIGPEVDTDARERELEALEERYASSLVVHPGYNAPGDFRVPPKRRRRAQPV